ncbi:MAG: (Fe-S)-binding protein [Promethearchaeota archaeon]
MSSVWTKARKNTPEIDCGLCGYTTCGAFARQLVEGDAKISDCPVLNLQQYADQRKSLEILSNETKSTEKPAPEQPEGGVLLSKPCMDSPKLLMAEMRIFNGVAAGEPMKYGVLDPAVLCWLLDCISSRYQDMKCSKDLAYAWGDMEEIKVHILRDGRIRMRRAKGAEHALDSFKIIERTVMGAIICNCCGRDLFTVLSGFVVPTGLKHTVLDAGSTVSLNQDMIDWTPQKQDLRIKSVDQMMNLLDELHSDLINQLNLMVSRDVTNESFPDIRPKICKMISLMVDSMDQDIDIVFLRGLAVAFFISNAMDALNVLNELLLEERAPRARTVNFLEDAKKMALLNHELESLDVSEILPFAHSLRVERAIQLYDKWKKK